MHHCVYIRDKTKCILYPIPFNASPYYPCPLPQPYLATSMISTSFDAQGLVLILQHDAVARILANGSAAFFGWKACNSVRSL